MARPLDAHEFDAAVVDRIDFDPRGLVVAEDAGRVVGFAHAGFGPADPTGPSHRLDPLLGTVAMLAVDPTAADPEVAPRLLAAAEGHLRDRGARVIYAGGRYPLDPFYRAIYGGSEWSGILDEHAAFRRAVEAAGYEVAAQARLLELDLARPEIRDPKAAILRRQVRLEVGDDPRPPGWWEALATGHAASVAYRLLTKAGDVEIARASTWDMAAFSRADSRTRLGLRGVEVAPGWRRQGFGRFLLGEVLRAARGQWAEVVAVATDRVNAPAQALYQGVGFCPVAAARLYRKPGP